MDIEEELACRLLEYVGCGDIDTDIDIGNVTVSVRGCIRVYGYTEDDFRCGYMNGTGYSVTTSGSRSTRKSTTTTAIFLKTPRKSTETQ